MGRGRHQSERERKEKRRGADCREAYHKVRRDDREKEGTKEIQGKLRETEAGGEEEGRKVMNAVRSLPRKK